MMCDPHCCFAQISPKMIANNKVVNRTGHEMHSNAQIIVFGENCSIFGCFRIVAGHAIDSKLYKTSKIE